MNILGISSYYHDSAACLLSDGKIVAAAQEERFTRKKHDAAFPTNAVKYCLAEGNVAGRLDAVVFYDKPMLKFHRLLETYLSSVPKGISQFMRGIPVWLTEKLWTAPNIIEALEACGVEAPDPKFVEHHESHAASAFFPSPFAEAAILTVDGVGEWATTTLSVGDGNRLDVLDEIRFPHSLGLLYSAFTYFCGFRVNSGEYKLMGLAPYGEPTYVDAIKDHLIEIKPDGTFRLNLDYFGYLSELRMTNAKFDALFGGPPRSPESPIGKREMDMARSIQDVTEEVMLRLARAARERTGKRHLCLAGGVALNCVANGKIKAAGIFDDIWIQPAAGDAGGALGAAYMYWHGALKKERIVDNRNDHMNGSYLGPDYSDAEIKRFLDENQCVYEVIEPAQWAQRIAGLIASGNIVGLCQGRMEFGPRSLGNRAIVADPRSKQMQSALNLKVKFRESFRPFAPSCHEESVSEYFELEGPSPYMLLVAPVKKDRCLPLKGDEKALPLIEWVNRPRSDLPAITHVDYSARVQTVSAKTNPRYWELIDAFKKLTGVAVLINTSFNVRGEPIICTPEDALRCFMRTEIDYLGIGSFLLKRVDQPKPRDDSDWRSEFKLD